MEAESIIMKEPFTDLLQITVAFIFLRGLQMAFPALLGQTLVGPYCKTIFLLLDLEGTL